MLILNIELKNNKHTLILLNKVPLRINIILGSLSIMFWGDKWAQIMNNIKNVTNEYNGRDASENDLIFPVENLYDLD